MGRKKSSKNVDCLTDKIGFVIASSTLLAFISFIGGLGIILLISFIAWENIFVLYESDSFQALRLCASAGFIYGIFWGIKNYE